MVKDHGLEAVAGVNIADNLGDVLQLGLHQRHFFLRVLSGVNGSSHDHTFVEGGGSLRQRHRVIPVQGPMAGQTLVVEGMAKLVSQGHQVREHSVEVGQNTALTQALHTGAECAASLAVPGIEVNPGVVKGSGHHVGKLLVKPGKQVHQIIPGILGGVLLAGLAHRGEQVVPGQAVFVAQGLSLGPEVLPEFGQVLVHGGEHGIQRLPLHVRLLQSPVQGRIVAPQLAVGNGLQLDGVQAVSHRVGNALVAGQFRLIGVLPDLGVSVVCQIPDRRKIGSLAPVGHGHGGGQVLLHFAPGAAAGHQHLGLDFLPLAGQQIAAVLLHFFKEEMIVPEEFVAIHPVHQVRQLGGPVLEPGVEGGHTGIHAHDAAHGRTRLRTFGIGSLPKAGIIGQLANKLFALLPEGDTPAQALGGLGGVQCGGQVRHVGNGLFQGFQVGSKGGIVKTRVDRVQIPGAVHKFAPFKVLYNFYFTPRRDIRQLRKPIDDFRRFSWFFLR